jgi:hypothetical protein
MMTTARALVGRVLRSGNYQAAVQRDIEALRMRAKRPEHTAALNGAEEPRTVIKKVRANGRCSR